MDNQTIIKDFLYINSSNVWDIALTIDCSAIDKLDKRFWASDVFGAIAKENIKIERLILSHRGWLNDFICELDPWMPIKPSLVDLNADSLFGAKIIYNNELPKHLSIACSDWSYMKAFVLVNNNWKQPEILPKISKFQWMQKQEEKEELIGLAR